ncbi:Uncharacterised protein [Vibrio cholerae]|nr:Uncharacterised protein [Vibrio cholerae]
MPRPTSRLGSLARPVFRTSVADRTHRPRHIPVACHLEGALTNRCAIRFCLAQLAVGLALTPQTQWINRSPKTRP